MQKVPQELQDLMKDNRVNRETLFKQSGVENYLIDNFWALGQVRIHRDKLLSPYPADSGYKQQVQDKMLKLLSTSWLNLKCDT